MYNSKLIELVNNTQITKNFSVIFFFNKIKTVKKKKTYNISLIKTMTSQVDWFFLYTY